jgi:hypothetical protein
LEALEGGPDLSQVDALKVLEKRERAPREGNRGGFRGGRTGGNRGGSGGRSNRSGGAGRPQRNSRGPSRSWDR